MEISEFSDWLRTRTNKNKLPFQERAIDVYAETARTLDRWMDNNDMDGDFTACDTDVLNRFFADYRKTHTRAARTRGSGTSTTCSNGSPRRTATPRPLDRRSRTLRAVGRPAVHSGARAHFGSA
jgi:hypothetical protein